jgi:hypothetical protein
VQAWSHFSYGCKLQLQFCVHIRINPSLLPSLTHSNAPLKSLICPRGGDILLQHCYCKRYSNPWTGPEGSRFHDTWHTNVVRLSALCTSHLYPPGNIPGTHLCWRLSQPQGNSVAGRFMSMKNSNDTISNGSSHLPACSAVHQPNAPLRTLHHYCTLQKIMLL